MKFILFVVTIVLSFSLYAETKVIYGDDNRVDVYASQDSDFVELSRSTAAQIPSSNLRRSWWSNEYELRAKTLEERGMCSSERFANQPTAARCSGFLVGDKYLVTAGHCIDSRADCNNNYWVFDYKMLNSTDIDMTPSEDNIYKCKRIISQELSRSTQNDYAFIELDRVVTGRRPLHFRRSGKIAKGEELVVIGHPSGLPTKIADGAYVQKINNVFLTANLDTYGGNSGSAVFNVKTGEVEGILVRGARDYVYSNGCKASNYLSDSNGEEEVTLITNIKELADL